MLSKGHNHFPICSKAKHLGLPGANTCPSPTCFNYSSSNFLWALRIVQGNLSNRGNLRGQAALPAEWLTWNKDFTLGKGRRSIPSSPVQGVMSKGNTKSTPQLLQSLLQHIHVKAKKCLQSQILVSVIRHRQPRRFLDVDVH